MLRLTTTDSTTIALLAVGTGPAIRLLAAWSVDGGARWTLSQPLPLRGAKLASASTGHGDTIAIVLSTGRAETITGPAAPWQPLPALPAGTATLAPGSAGGWDALAVRSTRLAIWRLAPGSTAWAPRRPSTFPLTSDHRADGPSGHVVPEHVGEDAAEEVQVAAGRPRQ